MRKRMERKVSHIQFIRKVLDTQFLDTEIFSVKTTFLVVISSRFVCVQALKELISFSMLTCCFHIYCLNRKILSLS